MNPRKTVAGLCAAASLSLLSALAFAAQNPLSVHVLNLQDGLPSPAVKVVLEQQEGEKWVALNRGVTDQQGRIQALFPEGRKLEKGIYRVTFKTGDWFARHKAATFFPEIPVIFQTDGTLPHYHIPLLLSPYGYSTYRGN